MSFAPDWTVLVQDLLSPAGTRLGETTPALISYHLGTTSAAEQSKLSTLLTTISTSPSLWNGHATASVAASSSLGDQLPLELIQSVLNATRNGLLYKVEQIKKDKGSSWSGQRELGRWLRVVMESLRESGVRTMVKLVVAGGVLSGLQQVKIQRDKLYVCGASMTEYVEKEVIGYWTEYFAQTGPSSVTTNLVPAWLASQVLPSISVDGLAAGPVELLIALLTDTIIATFNQVNLFADLPASLAPDGSSPLPVRWQIPSPAHSTLSALTASSAFVNLALTSRALARSLEAAAHLATTASDSSLAASTLSAIERALGSLRQLCTCVRDGWAATAWSDLTNDSDVVCDPQEDAALPWTALKSLLFAMVLVLSSVLVIASPKRGNRPTAKQVELAQEGLVVLAETYFVASKFGPDGFGAWRAVWKGLVEVVKEGEEEGRGERVMSRVEPGTVESMEARMVARSGVTFYLNLAEQLVPVLGDGFIQGKVLQVARPYLGSSTYRDTFESAHSVVLALFAAQKPCALELVPWYTTLLLDLAGQDDVMTAPQLRLAFTTMIRSASATDDALAWHSILQLVHAIKHLPASLPSAPPKDHVDAPPVRPLDPSDEPTRFTDEPSTRLDEAAAPTGAEEVVLGLPRGKLLLTLIDQASACSLFLLEGVLGQVWECVGEEGSGEGRDALGRVVFGVLSEGLSKEKREEGVRWWMERGEELVAPVGGRDN